MKEIIFILTIVFLVSCSKEEQTTEGSEIITKEHPNIHYADFVKTINTASLSILELSQDIEFREYIIDKAREKFDGDDNVLLKEVSKDFDLIKEIKENTQKYSFFDSVLGEEHINSFLNGIELGHERFYVQLYVPFIEQFDITKSPTIVLAYKDNTDNNCVADGLLFNGSSFDLIKVDEEYAIDNPVFVISINERVDNNGKPRQMKNDLTSDSQEVSNRGPEFFVGISKVKLSSIKECWLCGDAEVSVVSANIQDPFNSSPSDCGNVLTEDQRNFRAVKKKDLNKWVTATASLVGLNVGVSNRLDPNQTILFILYEHDATTNLKEVLFLPCYHSYYYKSGQGYYMINGTNDLSFGDSDFSNPNTTTQTFIKTTFNENVEIQYRGD